MFKINYKIFLIIIFNFFFLNSFSYSQNFENIVVSGNERIPKETILVFSGLKNVDEINNDIINQSLKKLYNTNFFKDVSIKLTDNKIIIDVVEFPLIDTVSILGVKAKKIRDSISEELKLKPRSSFNELFLQIDKKNILNTLKNSGYYFASVEAYIIELNDNRINVEYKIDLGEKAKLRKFHL